MNQDMLEFWRDRVQPEEPEYGEVVPSPEPKPQEEK